MAKQTQHNIITQSIICHCIDITKHTLYGIFALYSSMIEARIELSCRVIIVMKYQRMFDRSAPIIFTVKRLSEGPYLKSFISRVRTKHRSVFALLVATRFDSVQSRTFQRLSTEPLAPRLLICQYFIYFNSPK